MARNPYDLMRSTMARMFGQNGIALRNLYSAFGYPETLTPEDFMKMYLRNGVASRVIRAYPQATWRDHPTIRDEKGDSAQERVKDKTNPNYSPFTKAVEDFFDFLSVRHYLERADRLSSIGRFGILIMGFDDGGDLSTPLPSGSHKLIYLSAYGEPRVGIQNYDNNPNSPRYALPEMYQVKPATSLAGGNTVVQPREFRVHYSRVIHLAEHLDENEVMGTPRLMPVYNHLSDLEKVVGSGAETFWLNARGGMAITADKDASIDPAVLADMKEQAEEFENQLRRIIALQGAKAEMMTSSVADPKSNVEASLQLVAGGTGIPLRILIGSERGELSSEQDENNWAARIDERQEGYATPRILNPFVDKMIATGNLPKPQGSWWVEWPESASLSPVQLADVSFKKTQALVAYSNAPNAELVVPVQEFRSDFLSIAPESEYEIEDELPDVPEGGTDEDTGEQLELLPPDVPVANYRDFGSGMGAYRMKLNAAPETLYVKRQVLNGNAIRAHFKKQGIKVMTPTEEMHVTIAYSKKPLDWFKISPTWSMGPDDEGKLTVPPGGARMMSLFGKELVKNVLVLQFSSSVLGWRFQDFMQAGASWDWPDYQPHITISYDVEQSWGGEREMGGFDSYSLWGSKLKELEPWQGPIELGPEIFQPIREDWSKGLKENERV